MSNWVRMMGITTAAGPVGDLHMETGMMTTQPLPNRQGALRPAIGVRTGMAEVVGGQSPYSSCGGAGGGGGLSGLQGPRVLPREQTPYQTVYEAPPARYVPSAQEAWEADFLAGRPVAFGTEYFVWSHSEAGREYLALQRALEALKPIAVAESEAAAREAYYSDYGWLEAWLRDPSTSASAAHALSSVGPGFFRYGRSVHG